MFSIVGGTYLESCIDPDYYELYGSGLRAAIALSNKGLNINFHSIIGNDHVEVLKSISTLYNINTKMIIADQTVEFEYYHPLSKPNPISTDNTIKEINTVNDTKVLYYGLLEGNAKFSAEYVVYDPQNHKSFKETGATAKHLALILNKKEAYKISSLYNTDLISVGKSLLITENADVIVIKNGSEGALVFDNNGVYPIPIFETASVWPIGSGDIFSAVFAWKWMHECLDPRESAYQASKYTAFFCESRQLPLKKELPDYKAITIKTNRNKIYLASPFFTISERWLVNELRNSLIDFGNDVFSPYHDIGLVDNNNSESEVASKDLHAISNCDTVLAVVSGTDAGTLFEVGYAKSLNKRVIVFAENVNDEDLVMLRGSGCKITYDLSTAVYTASW